MKIANEYRVPLYPISTGRNLGYGGAAPALSGSVVLDLKRMNKILEVDERNAYALVEPGVSYFDLYRYMQEHKLKVWIDCPDPGWGSVIGNALDHGVGYTMNPYRDHWDGHCGMEVVTGERRGGAHRHGRAAAARRPGSTSSTASGRYVDGLFSQSNFGVVTKMGVWLHARARGVRSKGKRSCSKHDDIIPLVEHMKYLMNAGIQNCGTNLQSPIRFALGADPELRKLLTRSDPEAIARLNAFAAERKIPFYSNWFKFYGPEEVVRAQWAYAKKRMSDIAGIQFVDGPFYKFPLTDDQNPGTARRAGLRRADARHVLDRRALELLARDERPSRLLARDPDDRRGRNRVATRVRDDPPGVRHERRA